jgi:hypothetical protein
MDYRHTEDYARLKEAAGLRAHALRREAMQQFWGQAARWLRAWWKSRTPVLRGTGVRGSPPARG